MINVALGGSLYEDILSQHPEGLKHNFSPGYPRDMIAHSVSVSKESRLAGILKVEGQEIPVNSLHHQGIKDPAPGIHPTGYALDGIIESFELPVSVHPFGFAVQWHPEWLPSMTSLFCSLVQAAAQRP